MVLGWAASALAWLAGVAVQLQQERLHDGVAAMVAMAGVLALGWCVALKRWSTAPVTPALHGLHWLLMCTAMALLAWALTQWRAVDRLAQQWPQAWDANEVMLTGQIDVMPQHQAWGTSLEVHVQHMASSGMACRGGQTWQAPPGANTATPASKCPQRVLLRWAADPSRPVLQPGQVWRWRVRLHAPDGLFNPGGYDSELRLFERGIRAVGTVRPDKPGQPPPAVLQAQPHAWDGRVIERWRTSLRDRITQGVPQAQVAGVVAGLTVGEQSAIAPRDWDALRQTGTAHLAAISGLHITMMGWGLSRLVALLWRRSVRLMHWVPAPVAAAWAGLAGAWLYALLSGWGVPAQRTVLMLAVFTMLKASGRRWPWPLCLLAAAVAVTLLDPWALLQAGFWLSFAAVGLLMVSGDGGAGQPSELEPPGKMQSVWRAALGLFKTQWVASLGLAPLSLVFFQSFSPAGLLANLVCIPLFTLVITPLAMLGLGWGACWAVLAPVVGSTMAALAWLGEQPWASWQSPSVVPWASALGLLAGAWMLAPLPWRWRLVAAPALLPLVWPSPISRAWLPPVPGQVAVVAADVGQGTAVLVQTASHALLFDTGGKTSDEMDAGRRVLVGLLRSLGVARLDVLMLSHGDTDHVGGAASVLAAVPVAQVRSSLAPDHGLLNTRDHDGRQPAHEPCVAGQRWQWDGVSFEILHPTAEDLAPGSTLGDNARSCVLRIEAAGASILLTGDVEADQEAALVARWGASLQSDVLIVPHHGSRTSSTLPFLQQVQPQLAIMQVGARNPYRHPAEQVVARYAALGIPVRATPSCGAWLWRPGEAGDAVHDGQQEAAGYCWRDVARRYWHR